MPGLWQLFPFPPIPLLGDDQHHRQFIRTNLVHRNPHTQIQRGHQIQRAPDHQAPLRCLGGIQSVLWAVIAPPTFIGSIGAEVRIAEFLAPHCPVHEEPVGRILRPLPG